MEDWQKREHRDKIVLAVILILVGGMFLLMVAFVWLQVTEKMSAEVDCTVHQIDYVTLTDANGTGTCMFALVQGNVTMCALPRDVNCHGLVQDFPVVRFILERKSK